MADVVKATTKHRHELIFGVYTAVISELGTNAPYQSRRSMYEEVAKRTGYSRERVSQVIRIILKTSSCTKTK